MTPSFRVESGCVAVVVAYRSSGTLPECLSALVADPVVTEIVVVDNSSDSATSCVVRRLQQAEGAKLQYVDPGTNLGFAAACNLGIAQSTASVVALINPDVRLTQSLAPLLNVLAEAPGSVAAGGLADHSGAICNARVGSTLLLELGRAVLGTPAVVPVRTDGDLHSVEQVDGALLLVERRTLEEQGRLSEVFPLYYEDVELCWRVRQTGGAVMLHALLYGFHVGGVSSAQNPRAYQALRISRLRWLRLRYGYLGAAAGLVLTAVELLTRPVGRTPETAHTRWLAATTCAREMLRPMSQRPLDPRQDE